VLNNNVNTAAIHRHLFVLFVVRFMTNINTTESMITIDDPYNWLVLLLSILAIFGTLGNLLVCASICLDKQLQTATNWFLFSLAIADCLVSSVVLPLSIVKEFQGDYTSTCDVCVVHRKHSQQLT
jgi:hypothetical protein